MQCWWRVHLAAIRVDVMRRISADGLEAARRKEAADAAAFDAHAAWEVARRLEPRTRADVAAMRADVDAWAMRAEVARGAGGEVAGMAAGATVGGAGMAAPRAALRDLVVETAMRRAIDAAADAAVERGRRETLDSALAKAASPLRWVLVNGDVVITTTPATARAARLLVALRAQQEECSLSERDVPSRFKRRLAALALLRVALEDLTGGGGAAVSLVAPPLVAPLLALASRAESLLMRRRPDGAWTPLLERIRGGFASLLSSAHEMDAW